MIDEEFENRLHSALDELAETVVLRHTDGPRAETPSNSSSAFGPVSSTSPDTEDPGTPDSRRLNWADPKLLVLAACILLLLVGLGLAGLSHGFRHDRSNTETRPTVAPSTSTTGPSVPTTTTPRSGVGIVPVTPTTSAGVGPGTSLPAAPTTTVPPSNLPVAPPCDSQSSVGSGIRPATIFFGCATSNDTLSSISWSSWTPTSATGTATHSINDCLPSCAAGTYSSFPVAIQLSDPGYLGGLLVFETVTATPTTGTGTAESSTATGLYGSWGWISP